MADLKKIRAFAFDIDGVMTDGGLLCDLNGELYRTFDAKDGFAVRMARMKGYPVAVITGGRSLTIRARYRTCGLPQEEIYLGSRDKIVDFKDFCRRYQLDASEVMYFGDDIPDIETMQAAGVGACPCDAVPETIAAADWVSSRPGGKGCVREGIETVMKLRGDWDFDVAVYKKLY